MKNVFKYFYNKNIYLFDNKNLLIKLTFKKEIKLNEFQINFWFLF